MSKILLLFYLEKNPQDFVKLINNFLSNIYDKQNYEIIININKNSTISKNEKLKIHLNKYKNVFLNFDNFENKFDSFNKSIIGKIYDIVIPIIYDISAVSKHWDSKIRKIISLNEYNIIDNLPVLKKSFIDKKTKIFNNNKILSCKEEYYKKDTKENIFNVNDKIDFSYIICYRHSEERYKNLLKTINWLENFNCEIVIVEQDINKKFEFEKCYINYLFTYSEKAFNRSWAFNCGSKITISDIVVFGDCDLIIDPVEFNDSIDYIKTTDCQCLSPFKTVIDLKKEESETINLNNWKNIQRNSRVGINLTGGIVIYKKDAFMLLSGWNEDFEGWGGEDDYMSFKSQAFLKCGVKPYRCYHMWHTPAKKIPELYNNNLKILGDVRKRSKESFLKEFEERKSIIGNPKKYK